MKHIFIVNPVSGRGHALKISKKIIEVCKNLKLKFKMYYTSKPKEATLIAKRFKNKKYIIYSVGGDGTLLEVLNGVVNTKNLLGVVPAGSGNDFYRVLNNTDELYPKVDVGLVNETYFLNVASFGIDAEIALNANKLKLKKIPSPYNVGILYTFFKYKFKDIKYKIKNQIKKSKITLITICNGRFYGKGYKIAPYASVKDGLFDIYFVDKISKFIIPNLILKLKKGTHELSSYVHKKLSNKIYIESDENIICNIDGEIMVGNKFNVKLLKNKVTLYNNKELISKFFI
jgi:YegS/Rv2252/BmrU family lipid kinase